MRDTSVVEVAEGSAGTVGAQVCGPADADAGGPAALPCPGSGDCCTPGLSRPLLPLVPCSSRWPRRGRPSLPPLCTAWQARSCSGCPRRTTAPRWMPGAGPGWLLDHVNILLLIAGTYTPLMALALHGWTRLSVLAIVWAGAAGGIAAKLIWRPAWRPAPRWVSTSLFIALGWVALFAAAAAAAGGWGPRAGADPGRGHHVQPRRRRLTHGNGPTRHRGGSGSTRCFTRRPSWLTSPSTPPCRSSSTGWPDPPESVVESRLVCEGPRRAVGRDPPGHVDRAPVRGLPGDGDPGHLQRRVMEPQEQHHPGRHKQRRGERAAGRPRGSASGNPDPAPPGDAVTGTGSGAYVRRHPGAG